MLVIRVDPKKPDVASLKDAAAVLRAGGLVVYPTETAYALGCDPKNAKAVKRLFSVKKRDASKPLPMIAATKHQAGKFVRSDVFARILTEAFWPGPLTLVASAKKAFARFFAGGEKTYAAVARHDIALRVSPHPVAASLSRAFGRPIASTSANRSGGTTPYDIPSVLRELRTLPDLILDAGALPKTPPSTVVRAKDGIVEILREGPITEDDIHRALMKRL